MGFFILLLQNAWTNPGIDTRNVAVHDFILLVEDVPDSPPYFLIAPPVTRLPETAKQVDIKKTFSCNHNPFLLKTGSKYRHIYDQVNWYIYRAMKF